MKEHDQDPNDEADDHAPLLDGGDRDLDALCEAWVAWCRSNGLYWPPSVRPAVIASLPGSTRSVRLGSAISPASIAALHIAYTCQPTAIDKQVFDLYYVSRVKPIKSAAAALGIGRAHFYRVLVEFRRRIGTTARILEGNAGAHGLQLQVNHAVPESVNTESVS